MAAPQACVLESISLLDFVQLVLDQHNAPSTMIVCGNRDAFLEQLTAATQPASSDEALPDQSDTREFSRETPPPHATQRWHVPTLRLLSKSRTVKLAFCPDITHLRAYLATYTPYGCYSDAIVSREGSDSQRILAIVDLVQLHRPTSAFSAQGLNRTLSISIEAAHRTKSALLLAESTPETQVATTQADLASTSPDLERPSATSIWDEEVSILNVTTKSFGVGERGWVGRTVKLRTIAARWCTFRKMND
ncbi:hypothetical protein BAUCODRAFT_126594 [Baudoinia panamericana UAMH 10762]|uniref:Uncharacterized protein n=1 Tax=Baudoinia panamericana (strain UAMH 10762) TaxID=717646 RepID=M2MY57_BAUPA|nr:uncharacterized protein BAUCODRAFT_126594 [Baudoinia panamericana UAMH 10762]EMC91594.1 hypothetical protein BAUCODRAFT_126594 [Baudoinia panamericana UAMH 10762]